MSKKTGLHSPSQKPSQQGKQALPLHRGGLAFFGGNEGAIDGTKKVTSPRPQLPDAKRWLYSDPVGR